MVRDKHIAEDTKRNRDRVSETYILQDRYHEPWIKKYMDRGTYRYREKQGEIEKQLKVRERQIQRQRWGKKKELHIDM